MTDSSLLTGGTVSVRQTKDALEIQVPAQDRRPIDTIVRLELDGPAGDIEPVALAPVSLPPAKTR